MDEWDEADFAANRSYWEGQARIARAQTAARQRIFDLKGQQVEVTGGRKVPVGTVGTVFWVGEDKFGNGYRVGLKDAAGTTHWVAARFVETIETEEEVTESPLAALIA